jgi:DNA-binding NtrC family response regulator
MPENGKRILVVEGEPPSYNSLSLFLRGKGYEPHVAASATEATEALSADGFDLILCDYWLPDMDGLSFLKLIGDGQPAIVKILTSSYLPAHVMDEMKWAGIHDVILRPFTMDMLESAVSRNRTSQAIQGVLVADRRGTVGGEKEWTRRTNHDEQESRPIAGHRTGSHLGGAGTGKGRYGSRDMESALRPI